MAAGKKEGLGMAEENREGLNLAGRDKEEPGSPGELDKRSGSLMEGLGMAELLRPQGEGMVESLPTA